jgi:hypothetical protein
LKLARISGAAAAVLVSLGAVGAATAAAATTQAVHSYPGLRVPVVTVTVNDPGTSPGSIFLTPRARPGKRTGPTILDSRGRIVWFHRLSSRRSSVGLEPQIYRGKPVLTWSQRPPIVTDADLYAGNPHSLYNVVADDRYRVIARVRARGKNVRTDLHDLVITKKDTALVLGFRYVPRRLSRYGGPRRGRVIDCLVQEVDIPTNRVLYSWSAVNHVPLSDSAVKPLPSGDWDYFHVNSVAEDIDGNLLVSARHTNAVYKIHRTDGRVLWTLGGKRSTFTMGPGTSFWYQHDAQRLPDGTLTIFDNHASEFDKGHGGASKVLRLRLDTRKRTASLAGAWGHPSGQILATSQGNARMVAGGNLFTGWGSSPWFSEHAPDGRLLFAAHLPSRTYQSYRAFKGPWHANPGGRPLVAASARSRGLTVYASWNGATEIARWRVLGGPSADSLQPIGVADWNGLETVIRLQVAAPPTVAVEALDAAGNVLGRSGAIAPK